MWLRHNLKVSLRRTKLLRADKNADSIALEWVLDQHEEKKPSDPTIREKFDIHRFADYMEKMIDLLVRVAAVSVETVRIARAMKAAAR